MYETSRKQIEVSLHHVSFQIADRHTLWVQTDDKDWSMECLNCGQSISFLHRRFDSALSCNASDVVESDIGWDNACGVSESISMMLLKRRHMHSSMATLCT